MESVGDGFTWRRQNSSVDIDEDTLDDQMRERITAGAQNLRSDAFVKVSDAHLEAKARFALFDLLALCESLSGRSEREERERDPAKGFSVRPSLRHRQFRIGGGVIHISPAGVQKPSAVSAVVLQTVLEILFLASRYEHKAEPVLVESAPGSF